MPWAPFGFWEGLVPKQPKNGLMIQRGSDSPGGAQKGLRTGPAEAQKARNGPGRLKKLGRSPKKAQKWPEVGEDKGGKALQNGAQSTCKRVRDKGRRGLQA